MSERNFVRKLDHQLWQWRQASATGQWLSDSFYTGDINLLAESITGKSITLLLPGQHVVSQRVETDLKDRKLLAKVIPYQVEETIIDSIDDLVFTYGPVQEGNLTLAYVDESYASAAIAEIETIGADVQHCLVDYIELAREPGQWLFIFDGDLLYVANGPQTGFVTEQDTATLYLASLFVEGEDKPETLLLVAQSDEDIEHLKTLFPAAVLADENLIIREEIGGVWDFVLIQAKPLIDFRAGRLARKLPFAQWWHEWKIPASAAAAAFALALATSWGQLYSAKNEQRKIFALRDEMYRQVVPGNGSIVDPVRQLKGKLGNTNQSEPSHLVTMMSAVGPAMAAHKDVKLSSFRYTHDNGELQLNLEAKDIATLEALRSKISEAGLVAEIKRASVSGDVNQAQMRITEGRS